MKCKIFSIITITLLSASCAAPIRSLDQETLLANASQYSDSYKSELRQIGKKSEMRIKSEYAKFLNNGTDETFDILVLSGGGALGAFGAGFLEGWGEIDSNGTPRPDFDSVSGISTGALIAPFAFVGTDEAYSEIVELYRNPDPQMVIAKLLVSLLSANMPPNCISALKKVSVQNLSKK
jgi:predicted acylesterase/phospholipase RssA